MKVLLAIAVLTLLPVQPVKRSCGLEPRAPRGCQVNTCVCDSIGRNCHWLIRCGDCCDYDSFIQPYDPDLPNYGNILNAFPGTNPYNGVYRHFPK